jgi:hypothetical protein
MPPPEAVDEGRGEIRAEAPPVPEEIAIEKGDIDEKASKPKREKISRKKRMRMEAEKTLRARRGAKRIIEERIEAQESEQEAFIAVKEKEKKAEEVEKAARPPKEKEKKAKPAVTEEPVFGLFAEKLKTALHKKGGKKKEKK